MSHRLFHRATRTFFCAEPPFVLHRKGEAAEALGGDWCAVEQWEDADTFRSRNAAALAAKAHGLTSAEWDIQADK